MASTPAVPATTPPKTAQRVYRDVKALNPVELELRANALTSNRRQQAKLTQILDRKLRAYFTRMADQVAGQIEKSDAKSLADVDWTAVEQELRVILNTFYAEAGKTAAASASSLLGTEITWDLSSPHMNAVHTKLAHRITAINATTRDDIASTVADGLSNGQSLPEIADSVRGLLGGDSYRSRSMTIARTESQVAYNSTSLASYQESGLVENVEFADSDTHCDDYGASDGLSCCERNGLIAPLDTAQDHISAEHPNGSLGCIPILSTPLGES